MANTTNYNWETPDDTDLVKDGAAAIRTLGNSIDTTTKNLNPETTTGDIAYRSATANTNTRLAIGSSGQVLTVAAGVPSWATPSSAGGFTSLASGSLSGAAVTISTINQGYVDLYLIINAPNPALLIDDDSGNNFDGFIIETGANNAAVNTVSQLNTGNIYPSYNGVGTTNVAVLVYIYNYANTTAEKVYSMWTAGSNQVDTAEWHSRSTAAVSTLSINAASGTFSAGTYTLYGVK
jgi:hypothetical protein